MQSGSYSPDNTVANPASGSFVQVNVGDTSSVSVEVAGTPAEHIKGLSGRKLLEENHGMLFVFEQEGSPSFWMYDMRFPLDILWINNGRIVYIHENVPHPDPGTAASELPVYRPPVKITHVLEVNAGWAKEHEVQIGDIVRY